MAGHSGLTERPILNELKVIVAEGAEKGSKVIVYFKRVRNGGKCFRMKVTPTVGV
jgi:hypothetical protein